jgi:hypothetical protein
MYELKKCWSWDGKWDEAGTTPGYSRYFGRADFRIAGGDFDVTLSGTPSRGLAVRSAHKDHLQKARKAFRHSALEKTIMTIKLVYNITP